MNYSVEVILLSLLMFLGTTLLGWAPTWLKASTKVMNLISIFGAGMLVGAAIIVVIPEAVKCIIDATYDPKSGEDEVVPESTAFNMGTAIVVGFTSRSAQPRYHNVFAFVGFVISIVWSVSWKLSEIFLIILHRCVNLSHAKVPHYPSYVNLSHAKVVTTSKWHCVKVSTMSICPTPK